MEPNETKPIDETPKAAEKAVAKPKPAAKTVSKPVSFLPSAPPIVTPIRTVNGAVLTVDDDGRIELRAHFGRDTTVQGIGETIHIRGEGAAAYVAIPPAQVASIRTGIVLGGDMGEWVAVAPGDGEAVVVELNTVMGEIVIDCRCFGLGPSIVRAGTLLARMEVPQ